MADAKDRKKSDGRESYDRPEDKETEKLVELLTSVLTRVEDRLAQPRRPLPEGALAQLERIRSELLDPKPWAFPILGETAAHGLSDAERAVWDAAVDESTTEPPPRRIVQPKVKSSKPGE